MGNKACERAATARHRRRHGGDCKIKFFQRIFWLSILKGYFLCAYANMPLSLSLFVTHYFVWISFKLRLLFCFCLFFLPFFCIVELQWRNLYLYEFSLRTRTRRLVVFFDVHSFETALPIKLIAKLIDFFAFYVRNILYRGDSRIGSKGDGSKVFSFFFDVGTVGSKNVKCWIS